MSELDPVVSDKLVAVNAAFASSGLVEVRSLEVDEVRATIARLLGTDAPELAQFDAAVADGRDPDRNEPKRSFRGNP